MYLVVTPAVSPPGPHVSSCDSYCFLPQVLMYLVVTGDACCFLPQVLMYIVVTATVFSPRSSCI